MNTLSTIVALLVSLFILVIPLCIIIGIIFGLTGPADKNSPEAKHRKKIAWNIALYPIVIIILVLVIWGLISVAINSFK